MPRSDALAFGSGLHVGEALLELATDHAIHIDEDMEDLADERRRPGHRPGHVRGAAGRLKRECDEVMSFERLDEVELEGDLAGRNRLDDLHAALADLLVAFPGIDRTDTRRRAVIVAPQVGIELLPGRPSGPVLEIVD